MAGAIRCSSRATQNRARQMTARGAENVAAKHMSSRQKPASARETNTGFDVSSALIA